MVVLRRMNRINYLFIIHEWWMVNGGDMKGEHGWSNANLKVWNDETSQIVRNFYEKKARHIAQCTQFTEWEQ